ncbi:unnamed protein product [Peniophora sp. CBMAI 1063]|nr:unnamed protein product [Peniophora sp. CBMAI 1063]
MPASDRNIWDSAVSTKLTVRQTHETLHEHRVRLDDDIEHLERALAVAKELRNCSAPILTLPDEIILEIFSTLRDLFFPVTQQRPNKSASGSWLVVSAVCHRFRRIATTSPGLYSRISTRILPGKRVLAMMKASRPLDLDLDVGLPRDSEDVDMIRKYLLTHGPRVRTFSMQINNEWARSMTAWIRSIPRVTTLLMSNKTEEGYPSGAGSIVTFGPSITQLMPRLTCLHVDGVYLDFTSHIFLNLTELSLSHVKILNALVSIDASDLHTLLGRMKRLEKLALSSIRVGTSIDADIPLPASLRYLEYTTPSSLLVFSRFIPSPVVHVRVVQTGTPTYAKSSSNLKHSLKILASWLGSNSPATVVALTIRYNTVAAEACVAYWRNSSDHAAGAEPDFKLVRYVDENFGMSKLLLGHLYDRVTHIYIDADWDYPLLDGKRQWLHELGPLPNLRSLHITGPRTSLEPLNLVRVASQDSVAFWEASQLSMEDRACMGDERILRHWLSARSSRGLPLQVLALPAHVAVALDKVVADGAGPVEWRGLGLEVLIDYKA